MLLSRIVDIFLHNENPFFVHIPSSQSAFTRARNFNPTCRFNNPGETMQIEETADCGCIASDKSSLCARRIGSNGGRGSRPRSLNEVNYACIIRGQRWIHRATAVKAAARQCRLRNKLHRRAVQRLNCGSTYVARFRTKLHGLVELTGPIRNRTAEDEFNCNSINDNATTAWISNEVVPRGIGSLLCRLVTIVVNDFESLWSRAGEKFPDLLSFSLAFVLKR